MTDYGLVIAECDKQEDEMMARGIVGKTRQYYLTPDGTEYDDLATALREAPIITGEYEAVFDRRDLIGYRKIKPSA